MSKNFEDETNRKNYEQDFFGDSFSEKSDNEEEDQIKENDISDNNYDIFVSFKKYIKEEGLPVCQYLKFKNFDDFLQNH